MHRIAASRNQQSAALAAARGSLRPRHDRSISCSAARRRRAPLQQRSRADDSQSPSPEEVNVEAGRRNAGLFALAFAGAFGLTLGLLNFSSASGTSPVPQTGQMRPDKYLRLSLLDAMRACSPSSSSAVEGDGQHVYLSIRAPSSVLEPRDGPGRRLQEGYKMAERGAEDLRILSVYLKEPSLQIERPYTPLYADALQTSSNTSSTPIELLIKRYADGELGRYAFRMRRGDAIEVRGPEVTWQGSRADIDELVLIVGGTGITPAYQLTTTLLGRPSASSSTSHTQAPDVRGPASSPKIKLLYAANRPSSLLLLPELAQLQQSHPETLDVRLFVDEANHENNKGGLMSSITKLWSSAAKIGIENGLEAKIGGIGKTDVSGALSKVGLAATEAESRRQILVCGPAGFVGAVAGPKAHDGRSQGPLGGILGQLPGVRQERVWKL